MKDQFSLSCDEGEYDPSKVAYCWWRSAANFEELRTTFKLEMPNLTKITPRQKILREMERLALVAPQGLDEMRHKLFTYRSGDFWVPTGGIKKEEMDIPPVVTILLVGFHNAGKSSLVNLMYSVLGRSGLLPFAPTSSGSACNQTTEFMEEHNVLRSMRSGFCVYDTRGCEYDMVDESLEQLTEWMTDGVHHNQLCSRIQDDDLKEEWQTPMVRSYSKFVTRRVNCVMLVANIAEIYKSLKTGDNNPLKAIKQVFRSPALRKSNENPILILTHGDKLSTEDRIEGRLKICEYLGISEMTGAYDIVCVTEHGLLADEYDPVSAFALAEALCRALLISDRGHLPKKNYQDWVILVLSWLICFISAVFAFLADFFSNIGQRKKFKW